jgi:hypothetical protein
MVTMLDIRGLLNNYAAAKTTHGLVEQEPGGKRMAAREQMHETAVKVTEALQQWVKEQGL